MEQFLGYAIPGIPYGCVYAIVAVGLVLTYQTTGVFNFAFGAQAFMSAYVFAILTQNENFPVWAAFLLSVVVLAPAFGLLLDRFLFRRIPNTNTTAKLITALTLLVGIRRCCQYFWAMKIFTTSRRFCSTLTTSTCGWLAIPSMGMTSARLSS